MPAIRHLGDRDEYLPTEHVFDEWQENRSCLLAPAGEQLFMFVQSLKAYPPRQKSSNIDVDAMMNSLSTQPTP